MKLIRTSTVPMSLDRFCRGLFLDLTAEGYEVIAVSSPEPELQAIADREATKTYAVPMERHISLFRDLTSLLRLYCVFRKERPDMVHSITPKAGLLSMMAGWMCRVPVRVHTFTGLVFPTATGFKRSLLKATDRLTCLFATHIVAEGQGVKRDLETNRITRKNLAILGNGSVCGIDTEYFNPELPEVAAAIKQKDPNTFTYVFVGRLVGDKGVNELVEAFVRVNSAYPATRLVLIGDTEEALDPLHPATIEQLKSNEAIACVGFQDDVRPWLAKSDVLVLSSYREGFPNVVLEANAIGIPAIVTDINGANEIVVHGETGSIVPPKNAAALCNAMLEMLSNRNRLPEMGAKARERVDKLYNQQYVRTCLKEYYKQLSAGIKR